MNGFYNTNQAAGNEWGSEQSLMLHGFIGSDSLGKARWSHDRSVFPSLVSQIPESGTSFSEIVRLLRRRFIFNNPDAVIEFLRTHRSVAATLLEAAPEMSTGFGDETPLALEMMTEEGPPRTIYALALWNGSASEARSALQRFDDSWLEQNLQRSSGRIVFDYELI